MLFITVLADGHQLTTPGQAELFNSKIKYVLKCLNYLDRLGIPATVTIEGTVNNRELDAAIDIICSDECFRDVLRKAVIQAFRTPVVEQLISK